MAAETMGPLQTLTHAPEWVESSLYHSPLSGPSEKTVKIKVHTENDLELPNLPSDK